MHHAPDKLRETGHKLTPQRLAIWHLLSMGGHYSADDIFNKLSDSVTGIDKSTVYRTLELLSGLDLIQETSTSKDVARFEATDKFGHHHLVCKGCNTIFHFEDKALLALLSSIADKESFSDPRFEVCIKGVCKNCRMEENYEI